MKEIYEMKGAGRSIRESARELDIPRNTVRRCLKSPAAMRPQPRQPSPRRAFLAHRRSNYARHGHCGPPSSCLGAYFTPPLSPSIGTWPGLFALPCPSTLVSTPAYIASVDSGLPRNTVLTPRHGSLLLPFAPGESYLRTLRKDHRQQSSQRPKAL